MGSWLFGKQTQSVNNPPTPAAGLRIQSSIQGKARPIGWGRTRLAGNLLWTGAFTAYPIQQTTGGGGKGGGSSSQTQTTGFNYSASFIFGICEGPIVGVVSFWFNKTQTQGVGSFEIFLGSYDQAPWGYLSG